MAQDQAIAYHPIIYSRAGMPKKVCPRLHALQTKPHQARCAGLMNLGQTFFDMSIQMMEPNQRGFKTVDKIELLMVELSILTFTTKSVFLGGKIPPEYLDIFKIAGLCKSQWVRDALWYRYPILRRLAPDLSGFTWQRDIISKEYETLEKIVDLHRESPGMIFSAVRFVLILHQCHEILQLANLYIRYIT